MFTFRSCDGRESRLEQIQTGRGTLPEIATTLAVVPISGRETRDLTETCFVKTSCDEG